MKRKIVITSMLALAVLYVVYRINQPTYRACESKHFYVSQTCVPVVSNVYRRLNCFNDQYDNWKRLSATLRLMSFYRDIYGKVYSANIFGTKDIPCNDDELQIDVFDDDEVFLYIRQDTSRIVHAGALKELYIKAVLPKDRFIGILKVSEEDRTVTHSIEKATVQYFLNYNELNSQALIKFQQAIHYDSSYQKRFKNADYQLINKENRRHEASIRYEDFGERFYLDVF